MTDQEFQSKFKELMQSLEEGSLTPLEYIEQYMRLEVQRIKSFRQELKEKFPELLK